MPRKAYIADLNTVVKSFQSEHIREITSDGCDDGEFKFLFDGVEIRVLVPGKPRSLYDHDRANSLQKSASTLMVTNTSSSPAKEHHQS
jgi:hypothetical protein